MPDSKTLCVSPEKLYQIIQELKNLESTNTQLLISGRKISELLLEITEFASSKSTVEIEVKIAILETDGHRNPNPNILTNTKSMPSFGFSDILYIDLTDEFNKIARKRKPLAQISIQEVKNCATVNDCILLVTSKC